MDCTRIDLPRESLFTHLNQVCVGPPVLLPNGAHKYRGHGCKFILDWYESENNWHGRILPVSREYPAGRYYDERRLAQLIHDFQ